MKKIFVTSLFALYGSFVMAGDYSSWAVPANVEIVNGGVLIHGAFGDPNGCGKPNYMFVSQSDALYDSKLSIALAALMGQKNLKIYSSKCTKVPFHWSGEVINQNQDHQTFEIKF